MCIRDRPNLVKVQDVMPGSRWHDGEVWMRLSLNEAINSGAIKPALGLRINDDEKDEFKEGMIFDKVPEILTRGHVFNNERINKIEERAVFSMYIVLPTKFGFKFGFRVTMQVLKFIVKCRKGKPFNGSKLSSPLCRVPAMFTFGRSNMDLKVSSGDMADIEVLQFEESCTLLAATYLLRTATEEAKQFNKKEYLDKISVESDGIIYSKNRLIDSMEFKHVSGMEMVDLNPLGVNVRCPVFDRFSPLAYSFSQYIHYEFSCHAGLETCNRLALERAFIIQGIS